MSSQGTQCRRDIAENLNRVSMAHERYRRQTTNRQTDWRQQIANVNMSSRSLKSKRSTHEKGYLSNKSNSAALTLLNNAATSNPQVLLLSSKLNSQIIHEIHHHHHYHHHQRNLIRPRIITESLPPLSND